jgi:uncharacterized protein
MTRAFHPQRADLPAEVAVFPLPGVLLLPQGRLPLNVFEPRYLAMVEDALAGGRMLGMIQPDPQGPRAATGPALYGMGCLGRLSSFSETEDGRYLITLTGVVRFGVAQELEMRRGYRRVRARYDSWWQDLNETWGEAGGEPDDEPGGVSPPPRSSLPREEVVRALRAYFAARRLDANWDAINAMPDQALVSTLAMVCPFEPPEKQALLEAPDAADRARTLIALLQMGAAAPGGESRSSLM